MVDLTREVRLFHVDAYDGAKTGPLDHARFHIGTRQSFRQNLQHVALRGRKKHTVGAWVPVDALTRAEGATTGSRGGKTYESHTQVGRHQENVKGSCASVFLDIDDISPEQWADFCATIRAKGWSGEAWSSASCTEREISVRVHLHLSRELTSGDEVVRVRRSINQLLGNICDKMCFQQVSIFYLPATKGFHFVEHFNGPNEVDVDKLPAVMAPVRELRNRAMPENYVVSSADLSLAQEELDGLARRIRSCASGLRKYTAQATMTVGQRVAAGVLDESAALAVLSDAVRAQNALYGDALCTVDERINQIAEGIADGKIFGPALPAEDELSPRLRIAAAEAAQISFTSLADALAEADRLARSGEPAILALPPGVGKTRAVLQQIAESPMAATIYTPSHALADEHREALLAFGVSPDDIHHEMSALYRPKGGVEACARSVLSREAASTPDDEESPFAKTIHEHSIPLKATVCVHCPLSSTCPAFRTKPRDARVILAAHSSYRTPEPGDVGTRLLVLDEEPAPMELVKLSKKHLKVLSGTTLGPLEVIAGADHAHWSPAQVAAAQAASRQEAELADGDAPKEFSPKQAYYVRQAALALRAGRPVPDDIAVGLRRYPDVHLAQHVAAALAERPWEGLPVSVDDLAAVRAVLRLGAAAERPARAPDDSLQAVLPTDSRRDVIRGVARLLSATPTPGAYGDLAVYAPQVQDGCSDIQRRVLYHCEASNSEMKSDPKRFLDRAARLLAAFPLVRHSDDNGQVLVITHKLLLDSHAEALRALLPEWQVVFRHFGNVAGSNVFQEDADLEVAAIVTLGDYYANRRWLFEQVATEKGLQGEAAFDFVRECGRKQISQELAQAHGRARDPRRTRPMQHVHLGREVPEGWEGRFVTQKLAESRAQRQKRLFVTAEKAVRDHNRTYVALRCGIQDDQVGSWLAKRRPVPERHEPVLRELAYGKGM